MEFRKFPKIARLHRDIIITEKIDGTNACVVIAPFSEAPFQCEPLAVVVDGPGAVDSMAIWAQSRKRTLSLSSDNYGFAHWVYENARDLTKLGPGYHFGEWWGSGIQRGYGLEKGEKRFSLFNVSIDPETVPDCCSLVPVLAKCTFDYDKIMRALTELDENGSLAAPGFKPAEGIVVYHAHAKKAFKVTIEDDDLPKGLVT